MKLHASVLSMSLVMGAGAAGAAMADLGNGYGLPQLYHSEISVAEADQLASMTGGTRVATNLPTR